MKHTYGIMLTLNRRLTREQFKAEYCRIRLYIQRTGE